MLQDELFTSGSDSDSGEIFKSKNKKPRVKKEMQVVENNITVTSYLDNSTQRLVGKDKILQSPSQNTEAKSDSSSILAPIRRDNGLQSSRFQDDIFVEKDSEEFNTTLGSSSPDPFRLTKNRFASDTEDKPDDDDDDAFKVYAKLK